MSTHGPIEDEHQEQMQTLARSLDIALNNGRVGKKREVGFILLVFGLGEKLEDRMNYISNSNREDAVCALKEFVSRIEARHIEETQTPTPGEQ